MRTKRAWPVALTAGALLVVALACDDSETIAPDGSTITLTATPAQIILVGGVQVNPIATLATVRNSIGVPLPGQDVRFTTNAGQLDPPGGLPVTTDDLGNATSVLTAARAGATITATSGKATASITLNAATGIVSQILIEASSTNLDDCAPDPAITLTATALGPTGDPVEGFTIFFEFAPPYDNSINFSANLPLSGVTDAAGEVTVTLSINSVTCNANCIGTTKDCSTNVRATDTGASIVSADLLITDIIP